MQVYDMQIYIYHIHGYTYTRDMQIQGIFKPHQVQLQTGRKLFEPEADV